MSLISSESFEPRLTADGSFTYFSQQFQEAFHSHFGARSEAQLQYVIPCQIRQRVKQQTQINLLDICYGLGYNSAAAMEAIWQVNPHCRINLIGLEINPAVPWAAAHQQTIPSDPKIVELLAVLAKRHQVNTHRFAAQLLIGDARQTIGQVKSLGYKADAIFLDPFSPPKCPQLWTIEFIAKVSDCLAQTGRLSTYSCAAAVRTALIAAGLKFSSTPSLGRKSPGTVAGFEEELGRISLMEQEHLKTRASIPYRDPSLQDPAQTILIRRKQEQSQSQLESTSSWKKRWLASR